MLKIGSLSLAQPTVLAPMAALTDRAFRTLVDEIGGAGLLVTEMISAEGLRRRNRRTLGMLGDFPSSTPQMAQLFGADPSALVEAARIVACETGFSGIDFNMGCPVPKVTRRGEGAALLKDLPRAASCIRALRGASGLPLTVKIRLGFCKVNAGETLKVIAGEGADGVIVHFRLANDSYSRPARWEWAGKLGPLAGLPLLGNGDITTATDAAAKLRLVDGLVIGRGALANPFLFSEIAGNAVQRKHLIAFAARLCALIEAHAPERLRLPRLKAYLRYLSFNGRLTRAMKREVFLSQEFSRAKELFLAAIENIARQA